MHLCQSWLPAIFKFASANRAKWDILPVRLSANTKIGNCFHNLQITPHMVIDKKKIRQQLFWPLKAFTRAILLDWIRDLQGSIQGNSYLRFHSNFPLHNHTIRDFQLQLTQMIQSLERQGCVGQSSKLQWLKNPNRFQLQTILVNQRLLKTLSAGREYGRDIINSPGHLAFAPRQLLLDVLFLEKGDIAKIPLCRNQVDAAIPSCLPRWKLQQSQTCPGPDLRTCHASIHTERLVAGRHSYSFMDRVAMILLPCSTASANEQ